MPKAFATRPKRVATDRAALTCPFETTLGHSGATCGPNGSNLCAGARSNDHSHVERPRNTPYYLSVDYLNQTEYALLSSLQPVPPSAFRLRGEPSSHSIWRDAHHDGLHGPMAVGLHRALDTSHRLKPKCIRIKYRERKQEPD